MIKSGAKISNLPESLVRFRSGHGALSRRRGFNYARQEMSFFISLYKLGLAGRWVVFFVLPARLTMRLLPARVFRWTYFFPAESREMGAGMKSRVWSPDQAVMSAHFCFPC